jgi:PKD repeat protein
MRNQKQYIFWLLCLYVLTSTPVALCLTSSVIYVSGNGSGDYNCDGTNDQVEINQALAYATNHSGTTVYLKGPFVYDIESSCLIGNDTELTGDSTAILKLHENVGWITESAGPAMIGPIGGYGTATHDVSIHGFELNGNEMNQSSGNYNASQGNGGGKDFYRMISLWGSKNHPINNISVYDMKIHDSKGDGFRVRFGTNISCYNDTFSNCQHCCIMYANVNNGLTKNNTGATVSNSGTRLDNCQNVIIDSESYSPFVGTQGINTNYKTNSYGLGVDDNAIQICNADNTNTSNIIIKNCTIKGGVNAILLNSLNDNCNVNIYKNTIYDSGYESEGVNRNGGIGINASGNGIIIQSNDIKGSYSAGINVDSAVSGKRTLTVTDNDIMNGKTGFAVKNNVSLNVSLILTHNYLFGNPANYSPSSLIDTNPATSQNSKLLSFPGYSNPPTDKDHDGLYEDINGNGELDFDDAVAYYNNMDWIVSNAPISFFDYNKNGQIDFEDVEKLYDML